MTLPAKTNKQSEEVISLDDSVSSLSTLFPLKQAQQYTTFCEVYLLNRDGEKAAIAAGYSSKNKVHRAKDLLAMDCIQKYLKVRMGQIGKEYAKKYMMDTHGTFSLDGWQDLMKETYKRTLGTPSPVLAFDPKSGMMKPLVEPKEHVCENCGHEFTVPTTMYRFEANANVKAVELIGKHVGALDDRIRLVQDITPDMIEKAVSAGKVTWEELEIYTKVDSALKSMGNGN